MRYFGLLDRFRSISLSASFMGSETIRRCSQMMVLISRGNLPKTPVRAMMGESKSISVPGCSLEGYKASYCPHPEVEWVRKLDQAW